MMKEAREAINAKLYELLNDTVTVSSLMIPYYADFFGNKEYGIYKQSYRGDEADSKHHFGEVATIELVCFARGKSEAFVAEMSRKVRGILKASVRSTLQLGNGLQATYTKVSSIDCALEIDDGVNLHQDTISIELRIDETT
jgi:hypothetical protein